MFNPKSKMIKRKESGKSEEPPSKKNKNVEVTVQSKKIFKKKSQDLSKNENQKKFLKHQNGKSKFPQKFIKHKNGRSKFAQQKKKPEENVESKKNENQRKFIKRKNGSSKFVQQMEKSEGNLDSKNNENQRRFIKPKNGKSKFAQQMKESEENLDLKKNKNRRKFIKHQSLKSKYESMKPEDWNEFKKKRKELRLKRKQNKPESDVVIKAKQISEKLRRKNFPGGETARNVLINELHLLLRKQKRYAKFVLAHDTSRIVQYLIKFGSTEIRNEISKKLIPSTIDMLNSKYGVYCVKRLLEHGSLSTRAAIIDNMYGHVVKLTNHAVSAPVFEYAYTTWATTKQKQHLVQEFFGEIYKTSKDDQVKHLRDIFAQSPDLKNAVLTSTKANLSRILDKNLVDSSLVQTVLNQYLSECSVEDRTDLIPQLIPHIVVISNSKDGSRAAMQCIWHGTNKDRKQAMKTIKDHAVELAKHEHGHSTIITLLDAADDTVLLHKIIISELLKEAKDLVINEWGRKVLLWLVAPGDSTCFHPVFVRELEQGRETSNCKKNLEMRRSEILGYSIDTLLGLIAEEAEFWLQNSSLAYAMLAVVKSGSGNGLKKAIESIVKIIVDPDWKVKAKEEDVWGVEEAGLHLVLKKLAKNDQSGWFGSCIVNALTNEILEKWILLNRGCFLLVAIYENGGDDLKQKLKSLLKSHLKLIKQQDLAGSKILFKKLNE